MDTNDTTGWVKLFHPNGPQVTLPVPMLARLSAEQAVEMLASVSAYLSAGFLVSAPGLEDGEQKQEVVSVSRREGKDAVPIVAFYLAHPKVLKKFLHAYLNNVEEIQAFEAATGIRLADIPLWEGERDIDKDNKNAARHIVPLARPISLVYEVGEKWKRWSAEGGKSTGEIEPHKLLLVRYDAGTRVPVAAKTTTASASVESNGTPVIRKYADGSDANPAAYTIYDAYLNQRKAAPLSAEGLKAWYANPANKVLVKLPTAA